VFGQSLGAGIGHALIRRYPDRIEKLVLSSFGLYENENSRKMKYALRLFRFLPYWFVREYYQRRLPNLLQGVDEDEKQFFEAFMKDVFDLQLNKKLIMSQFNVLEDMFTNPVYYRIFEPIPSKDIMILQARDDTGFEESEQEALRKTYPNAAIHIFEEGGHLTRSAIQAEYDDVLNNFLGKKMKS
jgi:pimeloyl-ACP methyl ester carboxylesterase